MGLTGHQHFSLTHTPHFSHLFHRLSTITLYSTQQKEEAAIAAILSEEAAEGDDALAEAAQLVEAYGRKLTDAVDLEAMAATEGEFFDVYFTCVVM